MDYLDFSHHTAQKDVSFHVPMKATIFVEQFYTFFPLWKMYNGLLRRTSSCGCVALISTSGYHIFLYYNLQAKGSFNVKIPPALFLLLKLKTERNDATTQTADNW